MTQGRAILRWPSLANEEVPHQVAEADYREANAEKKKE